jgi:hypothetical protein
MASRNPLNPLNHRPDPQTEILKAQRMLLRIERFDNPHQALPATYTEHTPIDTRLKREWREYYVVARPPNGERRHIVLHVHKSRVTHPFAGVLLT